MDEKKRKAKQAAAMKNWLDKNPKAREAKREKDRQYRKDHPEKVNAGLSRQPEARARYSRERRARVQAAGVCVYCQKVPAREDSIICQPCQTKMAWDARTRKYGVDELKFREMLEAQGYRCGICLVDIENDAHIDHDHKTLAVRGLLCGSCNRGLGMFRDNTESLQKAIEYLRRCEAD